MINIEEELKKMLIKLLDDYYGDYRDDRYKEEVAQFIISYYYEIYELIKHRERS